MLHTFFVNDISWIKVNTLDSLHVSANLSKIMEAYDVFVSVKPKPKQPSKVSE